MKIQIKINGKVEKEFEADDYALCDALKDVNEVMGDVYFYEEE